MFNRGGLNRGKGAKSRTYGTYTLFMYFLFLAKMLAIASRALGVCVQTAGKKSQNLLSPLGIAFLWRFENHNIEIYSNYVASAHYIK